MTGRILEQIIYMLRPGQVERTQCIDWLDARGRGVVVPTTRDIDESSHGNDGEEASSHHGVANCERCTFRRLFLLREHISGETGEDESTDKGERRCLET